jgi:hypothetical protein
MIASTRFRIHAMRESTAEEYLKIFKTIVESAKQAISELSDSAGAESEKDRQVIVDAMKAVSPLAKKTAEDVSVPLNIGSGDTDWEKIKKILLKAPEPSREEKGLALKLVKTAPYLFREAFMQTAKKLPHAPGGHPLAMKDTAARLAACKRIEACRIDKHMDTAKAVATVAAELNREHHTVSKKTLRRYYDEYIEAKKSAPK